MGRLTGKIAIVTGAASGIGAASAKLFADEGAQVLAVDRPESAIDTAHAGNNAIATCAVDITGDDAPKTIVSAALEKFGALDILFNNAGVSGRAFVEEMTDEQWDRVKRRQCACHVPAVPRGDSGAEGAGAREGSGTHRQHGLGDGVRYRLRPRRLLRFQGRRRRADAHAGARARQVQHHRELRLPGAIYTGMTRTNFDNPEIRAVWEKKAALRRLGQPIDIARGALLLASDEADFITGHELVVDGGLTLRT
jgi:enoyl-[acyl-carrier-protein] reductase (NADH)